MYIYMYKYIGVMYVEHRDTHGGDRRRRRRRRRSEVESGRVHTDELYIIFRVRGETKESGRENVRRVYKIAVILSTGRHTGGICFYYRESRSRKVKLSRYARRTCLGVRACSFVRVCVCARACLCVRLIAFSADVSAVCSGMIP